MTKNNKPRDRWHGAGPKTSNGHNHTGADPLAGWFSLAKSSRINYHKRNWQNGGRR